MLLASYPSCELVLRTLFCCLQNTRGAIYTCSLTSKLAASLCLIIVNIVSIVSQSVAPNLHQDHTIIQRLFSSTNWNWSHCQLYKWTVQLFTLQKLTYFLTEFQNQLLCTFANHNLHIPL